MSHLVLLLIHFDYILLQAVPCCQQVISHSWQLSRTALTDIPPLRQWGSFRGVQSQTCQRAGGREGHLHNTMVASKEHYGLILPASNYFRAPLVLLNQCYRCLGGKGAGQLLWKGQHTLLATWTPGRSNTSSASTSQRMYPSAASTPLVGPHPHCQWKATGKGNCFCVFPIRIKLALWKLIKWDLLVF